MILLVRGFNYGIDFQGGTELNLAFSKPVETSALRDTVTAMGYEKSVIVSLDGSAKLQYLVRVDKFAALDETALQSLKDKLTATFGNKLTRIEADDESGSRITLKFSESVDAESVKAAFVAEGQANVDVTRSGKPEDNAYNVALETFSTKFVAALAEKLADDKIEVRGVESVGSQVGEQLRTNGFFAVLAAMIGIVIYLAFRFDMRFAPGALVALLHAAVLPLGIYSLFGIEFNLTSVAAVLTIVGYSVNDTIVVYDRIRENMEAFPDTALPSVINTSVNETLSRTLLTGVSVLLVTGTIMLFGGATLFGFGLLLTLGIALGSYSSVFVASPFILILQEKLGVMKDAGKPVAKPKNVRDDGAVV